MDSAARDQAYATIRAALDSDRWDEVATELTRLETWLRSRPSMPAAETERFIQLHTQCAEAMERARMRLIGKSAELTRGQRAIAAYGKDAAPRFDDEE